MPKLSLTCDDLPADLSGFALLASWREHFHTKFAQFGTDIVARCDLPGKSHVAIVPLKALSILTLDGKFDQIERNQAGDADRDTLALVTNRGAEALCFLQHGREVHIEAGRSAVFDDGMVGRFESHRPVDVSIFRLPRSALASGMRRPDDVSARPLPSGSEPLRMLDAYARTMMATDGINDPSTAQSISSHLIDLIGLALAPGGDPDEAAGRGGLRTGRVHTVLGAIEAGYLDPAFSIHQVAAKQRVTPRYVQELLAETGIGFSERVLELRLRYSHRMLSRIDQAHRKIIDVAFTAGFNDVSYFTRCFRTRFGMTPSDARANGGAS